MRPPACCRKFAAALALLLVTTGPGHAQMPAGPPSVGVVRVQQTAITETSEFVGRIQSIDRVALTARVTAFMDQRLFTEGSEVQQGDLLYRLERAPFEAAVQQQEAAVADASARLANANIQLARAQSLLNTPAGQRSVVDDATANQRSQAAQLLSAQAQLQVAQINLAYTEIKAPVGGKISRTNITVGNVVSPSSGTACGYRQPGPDVRLVPGCVACSDRSAETLCRQGGHERGRGEAASAEQRRLQSAGQDRLHRADGVDDHRHGPAAGADRQPGTPSGRKWPTGRAGTAGRCLRDGVGGGHSTRHGDGDSAQIGPVGSAGGLRLRRWGRQEGRVAARAVGPVDSHHGGDCQRAQGR